jgi:hypothetical protein
VVSVSNIENIINLINYANEWRNLKTKCMLHNYSLCSTDLRRNHLNPSSCYGGVVRKRNSAHILSWNNTDHSYMQTRGAVIWKWDVLDSSKDYPLLNSEDFITNYPPIWQKFSNNENIISLIKYANEWSNLKTKCMLHNYNISSIMPENCIPFRSAVTEELRGNEILSSCCPNLAIKQYILCKWGNKYSNEICHFHPVHPTDICVKNQIKTPHRLRARGDKKKKKKKDPE